MNATYALPQKMLKFSVLILDLHLVLFILILLPYPKEDMKRVILGMYLLAASPETI